MLDHSSPLSLTRTLGKPLRVKISDRLSMVLADVINFIGITSGHFENAPMTTKNTNCHFVVVVLRKKITRFIEKKTYVSSKSTHRGCHFISIYSIHSSNFLFLKFCLSFGDNNDIPELTYFLFLKSNFNFSRLTLANFENKNTVVPFPYKCNK